MSEMGEQIDSLNKMKAKAEKDKAGMERDLQDARGGLDESMRDRANIEKNCKLSQGLIVECNTKLDELARALNEADSTKKKLNVESQDLTRQIEETESAIATLGKNKISLTALYPGEGGRKVEVVRLVHVLGVGEQLARAHLPQAPLLGSCSPHLLVLRGEPPVVGCYQVAPLLLRDVLPVAVKLVGEDVAGTLLVEPQQFAASAQEDAPQQQGPHPLRVVDGVGQAEGGAPGAAKHNPGLDTQVHPQLLYVRHQLLRGVVPELGVRRGVATAPLVHLDNPVGRGVEIPPVVSLAAATRPSMEDHDGGASGTTAHLPVDGVEVADGQHTFLQRADGWVEDIVQGAWGPLRHVSRLVYPPVVSPAVVSPPVVS